MLPGNTCGVVVNLGKTKELKSSGQMERFTGVSLSQSPDYRPSEGFVLIVQKEAETHARRFCSWKTHHFLETRQSLCLPNRILFLRERPCQRRAHHLLDPPHYGTIATSCCCGVGKLSQQSDRRSR